MKKFAVAYTNFFDNDLKIKIVEASDWREALIKAFPVVIMETKAQAFGRDVSFAVVEIT